MLSLRNVLSVSCEDQQVRLSETGYHARLQLQCQTWINQELEKHGGGVVWREVLNWPWVGRQEDRKASFIHLFPPQRRPKVTLNWEDVAPKALCWSSYEEIPHVQGKRNPSKTVGSERGHQRADRLKPQSQKTSQSDYMDHSLSNSMKLRHDV